MRRYSATPLKHLSAAADTAKIFVTMSFGPPYRGGRNQGRRGFSSGYSYSSGRGQLFRGDFVRDGNLGFRQGERGSFGNNTGSNSYPHPQNPRPSFGENYQFRQAPPFIQRFPYRQHRPYTQNQQPQQLFRPQSPKPDYRNWEFSRTRTPLPSNSDRFTVLSYNILADYLAMDHRRKLYYHIPLYMLDWEWRKRSIAFELGLWSADIMCFQEVDKFHDLEELLKVRGYSGIWKMRTGTAVDGCAIFWRMSRFKLLHEEYIEFNKLGLRDNVAQICVLESQNNEDNSNAPPISSPSLHKVVICNIHVLYNPKRGEIKLGQVRVLLEKAQAVSKIWNNAPIVFCGDFNCTPKSALYNFISEQKLDLSGLDRDKVSGQASAEIHIPYLNSRPQPAYDSIPFPLRSDVRDIDRKLDDSQSNMQNQDGPDSCAENENLLLENHSLPPNTTDSVFSMSDKCDNVQLQMKGITSHSELEKESQHGALRDHKNGRKTIGCFSQDSFKESSISCAEDESSVDHMSENVRELASSLTTDFEEFHVVATDKKQMENVDTTCHLNHKSSTYDSDKKSENSVNIILDDAGIVQKSMDGTVKDYSKTVNFDPPDAEYEKESSARESKGVPSCSSTSIDLTVDENLEILSSNEQDIATVDGSLTEDDCTFLSALHDGEDPSPSELGQSVSHLEGFNQSKDDHLSVLNADPCEIENITFDRSIWTPMDIETATGNADCTLMEHPLKLISTYTEVEDFSRTRDLNGEPLVTSYNRCFMGTVDYIWRSEGLQTVRVLAPIQKHAMQWTPGFPTKKWGSDHIALVTELAFIQSMRNDESES